MTFRSTKRFSNFPVAHRDSFHKGSCALLHGYSFSFEFTFEAAIRNMSGHVMDFGDLKPVKHWLEEQFDHVLWLNDDDPYLEQFRTLESAGCCKIKTADRICVESTAEYVHSIVAGMVAKSTKSRVEVVQTQVWENEYNSALYIP